MSSDPILVATDYSDNARHALRTAARMAGDQQRPLTVVHCLAGVAELPSWYRKLPQVDIDRFRDEVRQTLETHVDETLADLEQSPPTNLELPETVPADGICDVLEAGEFDLAVLGATGQTRVESFFLGSVPEEVARRSSVPVLVVAPGADLAAVDEVVAPVDLSSCSRQSLTRAAEFARTIGARVTIPYAVPAMADLQATSTLELTDVADPESVRSRASERLDAFLADAPLEGLDWETRLEVGTPVQVIADTVEVRDADLIVMGTHGRRSVERLFMGSTATKVLRRMPCSVMTVRAPADADV